MPNLFQYLVRRFPGPVSLRNCILVGLIGLMHYGLIAPANAARMNFEDLGLSIDQPTGFVRAERFNGLQQEETGSSVVLVVLPGPFEKVSAGMNQENLAKRNILLHTRENTQIEGTSGVLLDVEQSAYGRTFRKWILVYGNSESTTLVTANYPAEMIVELSDMLRKIVLSVKGAAKGKPSKPLFVVGKAKTLKPIVGIAAMGKVVAYSTSGKLPRAFPGEAMFLVAPSLGSPLITEHEKAALSRLNSLADTKIKKVKKTSDVQIDGMKGIEILADGRAVKDDLAISIYMVMLFPKEGGYFLMNGTTAQANPDHAAAMDDFRSLAYSFKRSAR